MKEIKSAEEQYVYTIDGVPCTEKEYLHTTYAANFLELGKPEKRLLSESESLLEFAERRSNEWTSNVKNAVKQSIIEGAKWHASQFQTDWDGWVNIAIQQPKIGDIIWVWHLKFDQCLIFEYESEDDLRWFKFWQPLPSKPKE